MLACAGEIPTLETLAAASILRERLPDLCLRVVNVVDLMRAHPGVGAPARPARRRVRHLVHLVPAGDLRLPGYPWLVHGLTYRRRNHAQFHVRGFKERGTTTTPFDMVMLNDLDRYHLVIDVIDRVSGLGTQAAGLRQEIVDTRLRARSWTREHGVDLPEVTDWRWTDGVHDLSSRAGQPAGMDS